MAERKYVGECHALKDLLGAQSTRVWVEDAGSQRLLDLRVDLVHHADGFEWGYPGSGPKQLALAILADCTENPGLAVELHLRFAGEVVAKLPKSGFRLTERGILGWVQTRSSGGRISRRILDQLRGEPPEAE